MPAGAVRTAILTAVVALGACDKLYFNVEVISKAPLTVAVKTSAQYAPPDAACAALGVFDDSIERWVGAGSRA
jgi:hypothetical protein